MGMRRLQPALKAAGFDTWDALVESCQAGEVHSIDLLSAVEGPTENKMLADAVTDAGLDTVFPEEGGLALIGKTENLPQDLVEKREEQWRRLEKMRTGGPSEAIVSRFTPHPEDPTRAPKPRR